MISVSGRNSQERIRTRRLAEWNNIIGTRLNIYSDKNELFYSVFIGFNCVQIYHRATWELFAETRTQWSLD